jgi:hypothetical protein
MLMAVKAKTKTTASRAVRIAVMYRRVPSVYQLAALCDARCQQIGQRDHCLLIALSMGTIDFHGRASTEAPLGIEAPLRALPPGRKELRAKQAGPGPGCSADRARLGANPGGVPFGRAWVALLRPLRRLDVSPGRDNCPALPGVAVTRLGSVRGIGDDRVLVGRRGHRAWQLRRCFALWLVALFAIAPFNRPSLPVELAAVSAVPETLVAQGDLQGDQPATRLRPAQPSTLGTPARLSAVETAFGLPPVKPPLLRPVAEQPVAARHATMALGGEPRVVFERSSVGTARTPTGPPA